jgi:hypothetical protein
LQRGRQVLTRPGLAAKKMVQRSSAAICLLIAWVNELIQATGLERLERYSAAPPHQSSRLNNPGNLAILMAIRRASSAVSTLACNASASLSRE